MTKHGSVLISVSIAAIWSIAVVGVALHPYFGLPDQHYGSGLVIAAFIAGLPLALMTARLALRGGGQDPAQGDPGALKKGARIDQSVLTNTVAHMVLAGAIWPLAGVAGHALTAVWLAVGFSLCRVAYWVGCHRSPFLRRLGFAGGFFPTLLVGLWVIWRGLKLLLGL